MDTVYTKKSADLSTLKVFVMTIWKAGVRARVAQIDTAKPANGLVEKQDVKEKKLANFPMILLHLMTKKGMHTKSAKLSDVQVVNQIGKK